MVAEISAELVDTGVFLSKWGRLVTHVWFNVAPRVEESWEKYWLLKLYCHSNHRFSWLVIDFVQVRVSWDDYVHFFSLICSQQPDSMIQYHGNVRQANIKLSNTDKYWWERRDRARFPNNSDWQSTWFDQTRDLQTVSAAIFHNTHRRNRDKTVEFSFTLSLICLPYNIPSPNWYWLFNPVNWLHFGCFWIGQNQQNNINALTGWLGNIYFPFLAEIIRVESGERMSLIRRPANTLQSPHNETKDHYCKNQIFLSGDWSGEE